MKRFSVFLEDKLGLTTSQVEDLLLSKLTKTINKGDYLLEQGQICSHSFFVEEGLLRMYALNNDGKEHVVQFSPENWISGDRGSIYFNEPSNYFIDAIEETVVVFIDQPFLDQLARISPDFRTKNEFLLHNHIRHLQKRIQLLLGATAEERYLDFIQLYPNLLLRVPQWMIASYLGITAESLSRIRRDLAKKNFMA